MQLRELKRVAEFVLDTKYLGLHIVPIMSDGIWQLEALSENEQWCSSMGTQPKQICK